MKSQNHQPARQPIQLNSTVISLSTSFITLCVVTLLLMNGHHFMALGLLPVLGLLLLYLHQRQQLTVLRTTIDAVNAARTEAETAALVKTSVLATMSQEIRTNLNGVLGMLDLLGDYVLYLQQQQYAEPAHYSARTHQSIRHTVLDTASPDGRGTT